MVTNIPHRGKIGVALSTTNTRQSFCFDLNNQINLLKSDTCPEPDGLMENVKRASASQHIWHMIRLGVAKANSGRKEFSKTHSLSLKTFVGNNIDIIKIWLERQLYAPFHQCLSQNITFEVVGNRNTTTQKMCDVSGNFRPYGMLAGYLGSCWIYNKFEMLRERTDASSMNTIEH